MFKCCALSETCNIMNKKKHITPSSRSWQKAATPADARVRRWTNE